MKPSRKAVYVFLCIIAIVACKTKSKTISSAPAKEEVFVPVPDISLYDKPLDTIKKHITMQRWQLIYSTGGITGDDKNTFQTIYYTLKKDGNLLVEKDGQTTEKSYAWERTRDIFTGDSTYIITGIVQWKVEGIHSDTLMLADNYVDGYRYALVRVK